MGKPLYVLLNRRFQHFDAISSINAQRHHYIYVRESYLSWNTILTIWRNNSYGTCRSNTKIEYYKAYTAR
jgi:hypothetical protein